MINRHKQAAAVGDVAVVREILDLGAVDPRDPRCSDALFMACRNGHHEMMRLLLDRGAPLNPDDVGEVTTLTHAIRNSLPRPVGHPGEPDRRPLELLLAAGAEYGLLDAVLLDDIELTRSKLDGGGDVNQGIHSFNGPLLIQAVEYGDLGMVEFLLDRGADIRTLRAVAGVPVGLPASGWVLELGTRLKQTQSELVLKSRRVVPGKLLAGGFGFEFPEWPDAAADLYRRWREVRASASGRA